MILKKNLSLHFGNIYDLLNKAVNDILHPIKSEVLSEQNFHNLLKGNLVGTMLFTYFKQHDEYIELLFKRGNYYVLSQQIKKNFLLQISKEVKDGTVSYETLEILLEYHLSAVLGVINYWYQQGKSISEQDILQKIYDISSQGVLNFLKAELNDTKE